MPENLTLWLAAGTAFTALLAILTGWLTVGFMIRSRNQASHWRQRRRAGRRTFSLSVLTGLLLSCSAMLCLSSLTSGIVESDDSTPQPIGVSFSPTPFATLPATPITTSVPTSTATPTTTLSITPVDTATPVENSSPSSTVATQISTVVITPETVLIFPSETSTLTPLPATATPVPAVSKAVIEVRAIDDTITDSWLPAAPRNTFTTGVRRIYFYFSYADMESGDIWKRTLLRDGEVIMQQEDLWGVTDPQGDTFFFFGQQEGFTPGNYEIQVSQGDVLLASTTFAVIDEQAP